MSDFSDYMKARAEKENDKFFGEGNRKRVSNKYYTYKHVIDNDNIIINTKNVKAIKDSWTLIVDNNKAVYLRDFQVREAHNWNELGDDFYIVKLNRKYFKTYTFKSGFEGFSFEKENTFDDLMAVAIEQDRENMPVANGSMKF